MRYADFKVIAAHAADVGFVSVSLDFMYSLIRLSLMCRPGIDDESWNSVSSPN